MPTLITNSATHIREDLGDVISRISPEKTPFKTEIGTTKATATNHQFLKDALAAPNKNNAAIEGADAAASTLVTPDRISNQTQIFTGNVVVSGTLQAVDTAGSKDEFARQIAKVGSEMNRDIEAALVSSNASVAGTGSVAGKLGGAEAWIASNVQSGTGGSTAGYVGGQVGAVVAGTARPLTEVMFNTMAQQVWNAGGDPTLVLAPPLLKQKISGFTGNGTKYQQADSKTIYAGVDYYVSDFGKHNIIPHRWMSTTTVLAFDKTLWAVATLRSMKKVDIAKTGDADKKQLVTELTLECMNEAGNGKIADVN
ncbi:MULTISPECIES: DUF5309 domain-containing protein [unclassified Rhizobium]|uniref:DUF5309 domain-containing protein n=1 Tax=unclassified Rhizobium TaxID=2613769 RepID=UPI0011608043|nr:MULTISPECIES: DUF5309 domain-containing protein [unclassified Rhizobium]TQX87142.1 head protein [Rhizobium sp. rho-13.1]TQY14235.1 head protein [Rhizobium sp. rho-1.1]